jgi:hypothetical protein
MIKRLLNLEWKAFWRGASWQAGLMMKIFMLFGAVYFIIIFISLGIGAFFLMDEKGLDVLPTASKYLIYYFASDLIFRHFFQKMPVMNIRSLIYQNVKKTFLIRFTLAKTVFSFFNSIHWFFVLPFSITLLIKSNVPAVEVCAFALTMLLFVYVLNFLNVLLEHNDRFFYVFASIIVSLGLLQYYNIFDITIYSEQFFMSYVSWPWLLFALAGLIFGLYYLCFKTYAQNFYIDAGLATKQDEAKLYNLSWLDQFGHLGTFIKNDIKLITRNKRAKSAVLMSLFFLFYGLLLGVKMSPMLIFIGVFVTGGFLFSFGQFVPSWDSAYYPLMMTQNIRYKEYLNAKWWLIVVSTTISTLLCSFYIYFGWDVYLAIVAGGIYNIGINGYLVLLAGAYTRTPIDLSSNKNAFGDKKAFNLKTMLLTLPKLILPIGIYFLGSLHSHETGVIVVMVFGLFGLIFKNKVFAWIEKIYKTEKYTTIAAYKQK